MKILVAEKAIRDVSTCMKPNGMIHYGTMKGKVEGFNPFRYGCVVEDSF